MRENLAAGLLRLAGWNATQPLLDPLCGSGTIAIEAAMLARQRGSRVGPLVRALRSCGLSMLGSGILFERTLKRNSYRAVPSASGRPIGTLRPFRLLESTCSEAGVGSDIALVQQDIFAVIPSPDPGGIIMMNPPYGVRLESQDELDELYPRLGQWMKQRCVGWHVYVFTGDLDCQS